MSAAYGPRRCAPVLRRVALMLAAVAGVLTASELNPRELVLQAVEADELPISDPAFRYAFDEHYTVRDLESDGRVKTARSRTRAMPMKEFFRRRERFRRPMREIPEAFLFSVAGEELVYSRLCYVVDATPKPGYEPVDRYSKLFTEVKGRLWIDKQTGRWVKLEAELLDTVTFGWILVRIHKGAKVRMTQRPVNGAAWLPAELWYRVSLRIGLVSLRFQESETCYGNYRLEAPAAGP